MLCAILCFGFRVKLFLCIFLHAPILKSLIIFMPFTSWPFWGEKLVKVWSVIMIGNRSSSGLDAVKAHTTNSLLNPFLILLSPHVTSKVPPLWWHAVFTTFYCTPVKGGFLHVGNVRTEVLRAAHWESKHLQKLREWNFQCRLTPLGSSSSLVGWRESGVEMGDGVWGGS